MSNVPLAYTHRYPVWLAPLPGSNRRLLSSVSSTWHPEVYHGIYDG